MLSKKKHLNELVLFIFIIRFLVVVDRVRFVSSNNKILIHLVLRSSLRSNAKYILEVYILAAHMEWWYIR